MLLSPDPNWPNGEEKSQVIVFMDNPILLIAILGLIGAIILFWIKFWRKK